MKLLLRDFFAFNSMLQNCFICIAKKFPSPVVPDPSTRWQTILGYSFSAKGSRQKILGKSFLSKISLQKFLGNSFLATISWQ